MVSALDSGSSSPVSSAGRGHCVVFLGKTLDSHIASLHPGVNEYRRIIRATWQKCWLRGVAILLVACTQTLTSISTVQNIGRKRAWEGGGLMVSVLHSECWQPRVVVLCSWTRHFTLTVPLSTRSINGYRRIGHVRYIDILTSVTCPRGIANLFSFLFLLKSQKRLGYKENNTKNRKPRSQVRIRQNDGVGG